MAKTLTLEEKREIARGIEAKKLLELYDMYGQQFDPLNDDYVETVNVIREEILRRMK